MDFSWSLQKLISIMSFKKKVSFSREKAESFLRSAKGARSVNPSISESLRGTKGSRTVTTHRTAFTLATCSKAFRILLTLVESLAYLTVFAYYISKSKAQVTNTWIIGLSFLECYFIIRIIIQTTMIIFCGIFLTEFIVYTDSEWIKEVKSLKEQYRREDLFKQYQDDPDSDPNKMPRRHEKRYRHKKGKNSLVYDFNICSRLCSFKFCCRRCGVAITKAMSLRWSKLHVLCLCSAIYYVLSAMFRFKAAATKSHWNTQLMLYAINDLVTSLGLVLPPIAYSLMSQLKAIYEGGFQVSAETYSSRTTQNFTTTTMYVSLPLSCLYMCCTLHFCEYTLEIANKYKIRSIVQASKSILNDKLMRRWMFLMFGLQLAAFILEPIVRPGAFRLYLNSIWDHTSDNVMFKIHTLMLRLAIPLLLLHVVFSFTPKSSDTAQIMHYKYLSEVLSPVSVGLLTILIFPLNYFTMFEYSNITWTYVGFVAIFCNGTNINIDITANIIAGINL